MKKRGIGYGTAWQGANYHFGAKDISTAKLEMTADLRLRLGVAAADLGQGIPETNTVILSKVFGDYPLDQIDMLDPDTAVTPDGGATGASRQTTMTGNATLIAAEQLLLRLKTVASELLNTPPDDVVMEKQVFRGRSEQTVSLREVVDECQQTGISLTVLGRFTAPPTTPLDEQGQGFPVNQFSYATYVAEVEVDTDTGEVVVLRVNAYVDAGRIVRRKGAEMQVEGGMAMGLGHALTEEFKQREGWPTTDTLTTYLIPTIRDVPFEITSDFLDEEPVPMGELGVKGMAELTMVPIAPAIINAIYNATGATVTDLPATPERVLLALQQVGEAHG
jgi:CO/xanthine dehydrogenase Mo-binding subunit